MDSSTTDEEEEEEEGEQLDPRIQVELEKLNSSTDVINKLELDLGEARAQFRILLNESTRRLNQMTKELGIGCIEKSRGYYDARMVARRALAEAQTAAARYEKASSAHEAAKEMVTLAEEGFAEKSGGEFDQAWQEMLNHATNRVNQSEEDKITSAEEHKMKSRAYQRAERRVHDLQKRYKRSIAKSRPYFEAKARYNQQLDDQKRQVQVIEETIAMTKRGYADSLGELERISAEIHEMRARARADRAVDRARTKLGARGQGVGAENPDENSSSDKSNVEEEEKKGNNSRQHSNEEKAFNNDDNNARLKGAAASLKPLGDGETERNDETLKINPTPPSSLPLNDDLSNNANKSSSSTSGLTSGPTSGSGVASDVTSGITSGCGITSGVTSGITSGSGINSGPTSGSAVATTRSSSSTNSPVRSPSYEQLRDDLDQDANDQSRSSSTTTSSPSTSTSSPTKKGGGSSSAASASGFVRVDRLQVPGGGEDGEGDISDNESVASSMDMLDDDAIEQLMKDCGSQLMIGSLPNTPLKKVVKQQQQCE